MIAENTPHPYGLPNLWLSQRDQPGFAAVDGDGLGIVAEALMGPSSICTMITVLAVGWAPLVAHIAALATQPLLTPSSSRLSFDVNFQPVTHDLGAILAGDPYLYLLDLTLAKLMRSE